MNKVLFTDIDGTLLSGFITLDFVTFLHDKHLFSDASFDAQNKLAAKFKFNEISFQDWLIEWANIWGSGIKGNSFSLVQKASDDFFLAFIPKIYSSSSELITFFKSKGYITVGVSVGVDEVQSKVKDYLGLDFMFSSKSEIVKGKYTGRILSDLHTETGKKDLLLDFCLKNQVDLKNSFALGDTQHDLQMFNLVGNKVALNPNKVLLETAEKQGYLVATHLNVLKKLENVL